MVKAGDGETMTRDESMVKHLAEKVMGLRAGVVLGANGYSYPPELALGELFTLSGFPGEIRVRTSTGDYQWNPLANITLGKGQAMEVWERARKMGIWLHVTNLNDGRWRAYCTCGMQVSASGPRAIVEAVAWATGWEDVADPRANAGVLREVSPQGVEVI